tara:strand:+ start:820 stop:1317 length:498 start_codon:yes stop_codon:yes gene_type:complete
MWAVLKIKKCNLATLKKELYDKLGCDVKFYIPRLKLKKFFRKRVFITEHFLLGDYLLCFHKDFSKKSVVSSLNYCKGLKYFLTDFFNSQSDIQKFIDKCRLNEDENGFIKSSFFELKDNNKYEFISGPFTKMVFTIISEKKLFVNALISNYRTTVSKNENLFRPV